LAILLAVMAVVGAEVCAQEKAPIRVAIVGLVHGHAHGLLRAMPENKTAKLVAIYEPQKELVEQYVKQYHLEAVRPTATSKRCCRSRSRTRC